MMTTKQRRAIKILTAAVALVLLITSPLMVRAWRQTRAFGLAFEGYAAEVRSGQYKNAYEIGCSDFKSATPFPQFVSVYQSLGSSLGELQSITRGRTVVQGTGTPAEWWAETDATFEFKRGRAVYRMWFREIDGRWRLYGFRRTQ